GARGLGGRRAGGAEDKGSRRGEVDGVGGGLEGGGPRAVPGEPAQEGSDRAPLGEDPRRVPQGLGARQQTEPLEPADAGAEQTGGEEEDEQRGRREEPGEAHPPA